MAPHKTIGAEKASRINVFFPPEILEKIQAIATSKGLSVSAYIRMVITEEVSK